MYQSNDGSWIYEEMERFEKAWNALTPEQRQAVISRELERLAEMDKIIAQSAQEGPEPDDDDEPFANLRGN